MFLVNARYSPETAGVGGLAGSPLALLVGTGAEASHPQLLWAPAVRVPPAAN